MFDVVRAKAREFEKEAIQLREEMNERKRIEEAAEAERKAAEAEAKRLADEAAAAAGEGGDE